MKKDDFFIELGLSGSIGLTNECLDILKDKNEADSWLFFCAKQFKRHVIKDEVNTSTSIFMLAALKDALSKFDEEERKAIFPEHLLKALDNFDCTVDDILYETNKVTMVDTMSLYWAYFSTMSIVDFSKVIARYPNISKSL